VRSLGPLSRLRALFSRDSKPGPSDRPEA